MEQDNSVQAAPEQTIKEGPGSMIPQFALKRPMLTMLSVLSAAILLMLLWWQPKNIGLRWPLSVSVVGLTLMFNALIEGQKPRPTSIILFLITQGLSLIPCFRTEINTVSISVFATIICLLLLVSDFLNGQWWQYRLREHFKTWFVSIPAFFIGLPVLASIAARSRKARTLDEDRKKIGLGVLKGVLIALPLLLIFIFLFSSADLVFKNKVSGFVDWLRNDSFRDLFGRAMLTLLFAIIAGAGLFLTFATHTKKPQFEPDKPLVKAFLGMTETTIVLVSINLLFAFFLIIQFKYFFGGAANIHGAGFTYADYARKGFNELLTVAALAGLLYFGLGSSTRRETGKQKLTFSLLGGLMLAQVGVVLVSAYLRINLYIAKYGLTEIRLIPKIFIFYLAAILVSLVIMEARGRFKRLALVLLTALILFSLTLAVVNIDKTIARTNIERAIQGEKLDYYLLKNRLSIDVVPYLYQLLDSKSLSPEQTDNLAKVLVCRSFSRDAVEEDLTWLDWNNSWSQANAAHSRHTDLRKQYPFEPTTNGYDDGFKIDGTWFSCRYHQDPSD